jgi:hypothetical protein
MKISPMEAELFHAGGQTVMTKLIAAFRNFTRTRPVLRRLVLCYIRTRFLVDIRRFSYCRTRGDDLGGSQQIW